MATDFDDKPNAASGMGMNMALMMALMMGLCMGVFLLLAFTPIVGWPLGIAVLVVVGAVMLFACQRCMGRMVHR